MSSTFTYPGLLEVQAPETLSMTTADGVRLDADVYRPVGTGRFPVLLMRQAYGRRIACTLCYAHPSWYAAHGYLVVVQDISRPWHQRRDVPPGPPRRSRRRRCR